MLFRSNIGIDHVEYLGDTREKIAAEKAGIFKRGVPAVIGEPDLRVAGQLSRLAVEAGADPILHAYASGGPRDVAVWAGGTRFMLDGRAWRTPLVGAHQAANATMTLAMVAALPDALRPDADGVQAGLDRVVLPGRFQRVGRYLFDVAHNPAGAQVLAATLRAVAPPGPVVAVLSVQIGRAHV